MDKTTKETRNYKEKIFEAAEQLFYDKGYSNTSVSEIIELSGTNKGSFYHYYSKKEDLAEAVLLSSHHNQNAGIKSLFPNENSLVLLALENRALWYAIFSSENIRRFLADLNRESLHYESHYILDPCKEFSPRTFTQKEFALIVTANIGIRRNLNIFMHDNYQKYEFYEPSNFYLTNLFKLFDIKKEDIDYTLERSLELFKQLEILTEGLTFRAVKKNDYER